MKKRRSPNRRADRPGEPHSRIPDAIYYELLPYVTPAELKLWIALKSREWRKDGTRKGLVRKSLNRIAKDIAMSRATTQRAFHGLRLKGLAEWTGAGIRLLEPRFTTAITTGIPTSDTKRGQRNKIESGPYMAGGGPLVGRRWPAGGPAGHLFPFPTNEINHGRSDLTIRHASVASSRAVDATNDDESRAPRGKARASARSSRALQRKSSTSSGGKECEIVNDRDRPLTREEARAVLATVKREAFQAAERGNAKLCAEREAQEKRELDRRDALRRQAAELQQEET
jgi:hypothetical protein